MLSFMVCVNIIISIMVKTCKCNVCIRLGRKKLDEIRFETQFNKKQKKLLKRNQINSRDHNLYDKIVDQTLKVH